MQGLDHMKNTLGLQIPAVVDGKIVKIEELEDMIFAQKMIGDGYGIYPTSETVYAPCDGYIEQIAPTKHAVFLAMSEELKLLIHIGIDTIELKGRGFQAELKNGMRVTKGQPLVKFDSKIITEEGFDPTIAVILLKGSTVEHEVEVFPIEEARANETIAMEIRVK